MSETPKYAVMGNPVNHSKSPLIHSLFAKQCGITLEYRAIHVDEGRFESAVRQFRAIGGKGLNITVPFKMEAWQLADRRSARAELAGAVNTLKFLDSGKIYGENTDGPGMVQDIAVNLGKSVKEASVLVIGAGGAVRGVLGPLLEAEPAIVHIANRTAAKAHELAAVFSGFGPCTASGLDEIRSASYDIVINGTAASLQGEVPDLPASIFAEDALAYDMMYGSEPTAFLVWADENGAANCSDGIGMLVEQAAESFQIWHGVRPQTAAVIQQLR
ncbi:MAG TPA: shikimate dehydrogenase [Gammaproteobacteria bacterium]|nr:shikimate dehydrogenase [Gammaproteobacteria bacterium]